MLIIAVSPTITLQFLAAVVVIWMIPAAILFAILFLVLGEKVNIIFAFIISTDITIHAIIIILPIIKLLIAFFPAIALLILAVIVFIAGVVIAAVSFAFSFLLSSEVVNTHKPCNVADIDIKATFDDSIEFIAIPCAGFAPQTVRLVIMIIFITIGRIPRAWRARTRRCWTWWRWRIWTRWNMNMRTAICIMQFSSYIRAILSKSIENVEVDIV
mmetsp:Transcript_1109/g.2330  ORF Transcript_1109/g.2330 Transcript_1109/m.2330 type:complete len:214 (+) Transcript_1109:1091-1732(+)